MTRSELFVIVILVLRGIQLEDSLCFANVTRGNHVITMIQDKKSYPRLHDPNLRGCLPFIGVHDTFTYQ